MKCVYGIPQEDATQDDACIGCGYLRQVGKDIICEFKKRKAVKKVKTDKMKWRQTIRETGLVEWVCEHGCGHPDLKSARQLAKATKQSVRVWMIHGCDGCCNRKDFPSSTFLPGFKPKHFKK